MHKPDYQGGSIVNLMNTILKFSGHTTNYPPLRDFQIKPGDYDNIILIVVDGMGYEFINRQSPNILTENIMSRLTSVFPTTTASAVSSFLTGEAPLQHALTGWYMFFKELGVCGLPLPFTSRYDSREFRDFELKTSDILNFENIFNRLEIPYVIVTPEKTINSSYSNHCFGEKHKSGYKEPSDFFSVLKSEIFKNGKYKDPNHLFPGKMIYAYYPFLDECAHINGMNSNESVQIFQDFSQRIESVINETKGQKNLFLITADHGLVDIEPQNKRYLKDYPDLSACLTLPLCGEARVPYCYVRPGKTIEFKNRIHDYFGDICRLMPLEEAVTANLYGMGSANPRFFDRVGDFILHFKEQYVLIDYVLNEKQHNFKGYHGGLSEEELYVPLICIG